TPRLSRRKTAFRPLRRRRRTAHGPSARFRGRFLAGSELIGGSDPHVRRLLDELAGRARDDLYDAALGCHVEYSLGEFAVEHYGRGNAFPVGERIERLVGRTLVESFEFPVEKPGVTRFVPDHAPDVTGQRRRFGRFLDRRFVVRIRFSGSFYRGGFGCFGGF